MNDKFKAILKGIEKIEEENNPRRENEEFFIYNSRINYGMACKLAMIIQNITSANKDDRERAKAKVRELVKLGKETESEKLTPDNDNELPGMWTKSDFTGGQCG